MIYYAGHGIEVNGVNYLVPVDAELAVDRNVQFETVPLDQRWSRFPGQNGGLAKVDSGFDYAANFSCSWSIA